MITQTTQPVLIARRRLLIAPLLLGLDVVARESALASSVSRELVAQVERDEGLLAPLTLGIARVVLPPGASAQATTPGGARMILVESGVLAVAAGTQARMAFSSAELVTSSLESTDVDELFVPAGTTVTFGSLGPTRLRNPGGRSVVVLDVAVFHEEPRPISRAFTTDDGISFQLLASASAEDAPRGPVALILERIRLGAKSVLPKDLSRGLTLTYIESGTLELRPLMGEVFAARAAASTPYSTPGSLRPVAPGGTRGITAGGIIFLPQGAAGGLTNGGERSAELLTLAVREVA